MKISNIPKRIYFKIQRIVSKLSINRLYFQHIYNKKILSSNPVICKQNDIEIHIVTSKKDCQLALWAIKSFFHYAGLNPQVVIHEDGSLSKKEIKMLNEHIQGCKVIPKKVANKEMTEFLLKYPETQKIRKNKNFYCAMKLLDILKYSSANQLILLDSDVFFFNKPIEILNHLKNKDSFFMCDYQNAYAQGALNYLKDKKLKILPKINAGLVGISKSFYINNLLFIESYFKDIQNYEQPSDINRHEQTLHAILLTKAKAKRLSRKHSISCQKINNDTIAHHFVNDGNRSVMYTRGLKTLKRNKLIRSI